MGLGSDESLQKICAKSRCQQLKKTEDEPNCQLKDPTHLRSLVDDGPHKQLPLGFSKMYHIVRILNGRNMCREHMLNNLCAFLCRKVKSHKQDAGGSTWTVK